MEAINFYGCDMYEIIISLARLLQRLGDRILIADYSDSATLSKGISNYMGMDTSGEPVNYYGLHFIDLTGYVEEKAEYIISSLSEKYAYDCLITDFGYNGCSGLCEEKTNNVYVTDQQLHNIYDISRCYFANGEVTNNNSYFIIKDIYSNRLNSRGILTDVLKTFSKDRILSIIHDDYDALARLLIIYEPDLKIHKLSENIRRVISELASELHPEIAKKEIVNKCNNKSKRTKYYGNCILE